MELGQLPLPDQTPFRPHNATNAIHFLSAWVTLLCILCVPHLCMFTKAHHSLFFVQKEHVHLVWDWWDPHPPVLVQPCCDAILNTDQQASQWPLLFVLHFLLFWSRDNDLFIPFAINTKRCEECSQACCVRHEWCTVHTAVNLYCASLFSPVLGIRPSS